VWPPSPKVVGLWRFERVTTLCLRGFDRPSQPEALLLPRVQQVPRGLGSFSPGSTSVCAFTTPLEESQQLVLGRSLRNDHVSASIDVSRGDRRMFRVLASSKEPARPQLRHKRRDKCR
jgi:hypothetical protein